jgi:hypothetical protein
VQGNNWTDMVQNALSSTIAVTTFYQQRRVGLSGNQNNFLF